jgi:hypothetical protein
MQQAESSGQHHTPYCVQQAEVPILAAEDEFGQIPCPKKAKFNNTVKCLAGHMSTVRDQLYLKELVANATDEECEIHEHHKQITTQKQLSNGEGDALDPSSPHYVQALAAPQHISQAPTPECAVSLGISDEAVDQLASGMDVMPIPESQFDISLDIGYDRLFEERYVPLNNFIIPNSHSSCAVTCSLMMDSEDKGLAQDYICHYTLGNCKECLARFKQEPVWILDSGASAHFTHSMADYSDYDALPKPEKVMTAGCPIWIVRQGTVIIDHMVISNGKSFKLTMRLTPVMLIPNLTHQLLSLGSFLKQGMCIYGDAATISLAAKG